VFIDDQRRSDLVAANLENQIGSSVAALPWHRTQPELAAFIAMKVGSARFIEVLIAVLVAAGIFNTLFISVMERLREFGIMNAIGFSSGKIFGLVMLESFWLALVGLAASLVVTAGPYFYLASTGINIGALVGDTGNLEVAGVGLPETMRVGIFPENAAIIAIAAVLAIILSGLYPAWKAGHVEPIESIRLV
jgi:ABC-type lipoprotein release transport system permease subunit